MAEISIIDNIYQQFIDYYGEDKVDLQTYTPGTHHIDSYTNISRGDKLIFVHWPTVTVTNEYDESIDIWDLYSITVVTPSGHLKGVPYFNRSTYDYIQWQSDYAHKM